MLFLKNLDTYKKYCFNFQSIQEKKNLCFLFSVCKMVKIVDVYKSLNISIATVMKNLEMLKLVFDYLETKKCGSMQLKN